MIRAGRRAYVRTMEDLARTRNISVGTFRNKKLHTAEGHPATISSPGARVKLWDGQQTDAYYAGKPVPELPAEDSDEDLLDRQEAAAELGVTPKSWDTYKTDDQLAKRMVEVKGVEHWPRSAVRAYKDARPGWGNAPGRPKGSGDMVPRDALLTRTAELLDADPAVTAAHVVDVLQIAMTTAQSALAQLRGQRIADVVERDPALTPQQAAEQLGYPAAARRRALAMAEQEQRLRAVRPYLQTISDALAEAGVTESAEIDVQRLAGGALTAVVRLRPDGAAPALVWDERYGWRTAVSRRHPVGKDTGTAPEGEGIRYLGAGLQPDAAELISGLADDRKGSRRPRAPRA